jgi:phosphoribosylaminoimidazolecarboxamide formyltransferase / IMP cyclohydrolase
VRIRRALISVHDKEGVTRLARGLVEEGVEIVSSGGTAATLERDGVPVTHVDEVTGAPELLGGRVKTLHPAIHGGILARRDVASHMGELSSRGIAPIDLVICNLYPFERTVAQPGVTETDALEQIDIGGPAMVRAAAKNWPSVCVVVSPRRYEEVLGDIRGHGEVSNERRRELALEAFSHTAAYDAAIAAYLAGDGAFPDDVVFRGKKVTGLRYGENPHQSAAFYATGMPRTGLAAARQLHGKEISYNNLLDADAAWKLVGELEHTGVAIIKHSNPCGVAVANSVSDAYRAAFECDPTSAYGGIVALNVACDASAARLITEVFTEVVLAPDFSDEALEVLRAKKNLRIMRMSQDLDVGMDVRRVAGGLLVQSQDPPDPAVGTQVVTEAKPTPQQWDDLRLAWIVAKHVKSNAIVLVRDGMAVGVGAGQMNRVESAELASRRAGDRASGSACASDAFFPFRDGLDAAVAAGAAAVIQPGGSVRDEEVIAAANEHGIPMVFTGRRHFRH